MRAMRPESRAYAMLALVMLLWAGNAIVGRAVRHDIPPFTLALVRWAGALLVLTPFAMRQVIADRAAILRAWRPILLLGLLGVAAFNAFLYSGLRYTSATNGLLLQAAIPALVLACDFAFFRIRPTIGAMLGVLLSTIGVVLIVFRADPAAILELRLGFGDGLVLCGVIVWSLYTSLLRLRPALHALSFLAATFVIGAVAMLPLAATEAPEIAAIAWRPEIFAAAAYVAVLPSVIAYFLFNKAVAVVGSARAGQAITLMPLFGALLAAALLGEPLQPYHFVGMALIVLGIATTAWLGARRAVSAPIPDRNAPSPS